MYSKKIGLLVVVILIHFVLNAQDNTAIFPTDSVSIKDSSQKAISAENTKLPKQKYAGPYQWRLGIDIARIGFNIADPNRQTYELQLDYKDSDKRYWVLETGYGSGKVDFDYLAYKTQAGFIKIGLDNSMFKPMSKRDFDIVFFGVRYGMALGNRQEATYSFDSPFGGTFVGTADPESFFIHWGEVNIGMKLEVWKRVYLGWTGRAKFLFNAGTFKEIKPTHIAGYGSADKSTSFDINLYLSYALIRYNRK